MAYNLRLNLVSYLASFSEKADCTTPLLPTIVTFYTELFFNDSNALGLIYVSANSSGFLRKTLAISMATFPFPIMVTSLTLFRFN